jgi:hypothetical protein
MPPITASVTSSRPCRSASWSTASAASSTRAASASTPWASSVSTSCLAATPSTSSLRASGRSTRSIAAMARGEASARADAAHRQGWAVVRHRGRGPLQARSWRGQRRRRRRAASLNSSRVAAPNSKATVRARMCTLSSATRSGPSLLTHACRLDTVGRGGRPHAACVEFSAAQSRCRGVPGLRHRTCRAARTRRTQRRTTSARQVRLADHAHRPCIDGRTRRWERGCTGRRHCGGDPYRRRWRLPCRRSVGAPRSWRRRSCDAQRAAARARATRRRRAWRRRGRPRGWQRQQRHLRESARLWGGFRCLPGCQRGHADRNGRRLVDGRIGSAVVLTASAVIANPAGAHLDAARSGGTSRDGHAGGPILGLRAW